MPFVCCEVRINNNGPIILCYARVVDSGVVDRKLSLRHVVFDIGVILKLVTLYVLRPDVFRFRFGTIGLLRVLLSGLSLFVHRFRSKCLMVASQLFASYKDDDDIELPAVYVSGTGYFAT
jgi:hypothetical protein